MQVPFNKWKDERYKITSAHTSTKAIEIRIEYEGNLKDVTETGNQLCVFEQFDVPTLSNTIGNHGGD